jgi:hypothetical protein
LGKVGMSFSKMQSREGDTEKKEERQNSVNKENIDKYYQKNSKYKR